MRPPETVDRLLITAVPNHPGRLQLMIDHQRHHLTAELAWLDELSGRRETGLPLERLFPQKEVDNSPNSGADD